MIETEHYSGDHETGAPGARSIRYGIAERPAYETSLPISTVEPAEGSETVLILNSQPAGGLSFRRIFTRYAVVSAVTAGVIERLDHPNWIPTAAIAAACAMLAARSKD